LHFAARQGDDFTYRFVDVEPVLPRGNFLDESANPGDDFAGSMAVCDDTRGRLPRFFQLLRVKPTQAGTGVIDHCGERLVDFMGDGGSQLAQSCHPRDVGQLRLCMVQRIFGSFALDKLPYLAAYGSHHVEQVLIGLPYLVAEELHDPQNFAAEQDGKTEGRVQHFARGDGRARKISITDDIGNVYGLTAEPDSARKPDPGYKSGRVADGLKFRDL